MFQIKKEINFLVMCGWFMHVTGKSVGRLTKYVCTICMRRIHMSSTCRAANKYYVGNLPRYTNFARKFPTHQPQCRNDSYKVLDIYRNSSFCKNNSYKVLDIYRNSSFCKNNSYNVLDIYRNSLFCRNNSCKSVVIER